MNKLNIKKNSKDNNRKLLHFSSLQNKKANTSISKTLTWLVATLIIFAVIAISLFITYTTSLTKGFTRGDLFVEMGKKYDVLAEKNVIAFQIKEENKKEIEKILTNYEK
jgi:hypothetical protein